MMRAKYLFTFALVGTTLIAADADAFWKGIGKFSGPGPFWGFDLILPLEPGVPHISRRMLENSENVGTLNDFFYHRDKPKDRLLTFKTSLDQLVLDEKLVQRIGQRLNHPGLKDWPTGIENDARNAFSEQFLEAFLGTQAGVVSVLTDEVYVQLALLQFFDEWAAEINSEIGRRARFFGFSCLGLCTSQRIVRLSKDKSPELSKDKSPEKVEIGDLLLTFSLGYQQSRKNDLSYESYGGSRTVRWLTFYPALEWRFGRTGWKNVNFFVNAGPAFHYFWGEAFDVFPRVSPRGRAGVRLWSFSVGAQVDRFFPRIEHTEFGSTDLRDHDIAYGIFIGWEFPSVLWNR
jgi:hypothetical protein